MSVGVQAKISDLQSTNNNLMSIKSKLESELATAHADLDEATKELHAADERANRALVRSSPLFFVDITSTTGGRATRTRHVA